MGLFFKSSPTALLSAIAWYPPSANAGAGRTPQRQFQDKSYFMGVLRSKMGELQTEINRLRQETAAATDEQSTFLAYDKRVKELAGELTEAQGVLADYNLLVDKLNTDSERSEVTGEVADLKVQNESEQQESPAKYKAQNGFINITCQYKISGG